MPKKGRFTAEEDQFLLNNYLTMPAKKMSDVLGRSATTAAQRLKVLGVVIPPEVTEKFKKMGQLKPGDVPPNKGKKQSEFMSPEAIARTKKTRFYKGHLPHNTKEADGTIVQRRDNTGRYYHYIRLSIGRWELLHREVWRKAYGHIPAGMIIAFKDGNYLNCDINNLEMITRAENMQRNTLHRYPADLKKTIVALSKLKKAVKNEQH